MQSQLKDALQKLEEAGVLGPAKEALQALVSSARKAGYDKALTTRIVTSLVDQEFNNSRPAPAQRAKANSVACLMNLSLSQLYTKYIDNCQVYSTQQGNDLDYLVIFIQSDFGKDNIYSRSFSRSKKDAFALNKNRKPGPTSYCPRAFRPSSPAHSIGRSVKTRLEFKPPDSPGPGTYKPLVKILSSRRVSH